MRLLGFDVHRPPAPVPFGELGRLLDRLAVDHVIDVGANDGQFADGLRRHAGFVGRIDCVEPQPRCAAVLRERGDVTVHEVALGQAAGRLDLTIYRDTSLASLHSLNATGLAVWDDPATADVLEVIEVPVVTLDSLMEELPLGERLWVKLDTQGHDLAVLAGLDRQLDRVVGLQSELAFTPLYEGAPEVWTHLEALAAKAFRLAALAPIGRIGELEFTEADGLFVRQR